MSVFLKKKKKSVEYDWLNSAPCTGFTGYDVHGLERLYIWRSLGVFFWNSVVLSLSQMLHVVLYFHGFSIT